MKRLPDFCKKGFKKRRNRKCRCRECRKYFMAADKKAAHCDHCLEYVEFKCACGCGTEVKRRRFMWRYSAFVQNHDKRGKTYKEIYGELDHFPSGYQKGQNNLACRPEIGAKISKAMLMGAHWVNNPTEFKLAADRMRERHKANKLIKKTSKPEDLVASFFPEWERQYIIEWYTVDFAIPESKIAIEVQGCFWHSCAQCGFAPTTKHQKINQMNDKRKRTLLTKLGWIIIDIWEHDCNETFLSNYARNWDRCRTSGNQPSLEMF